MVEQLNNYGGTSDGGIVEHLMVERWTNYDGAVEHLMVEQ